MNSVMLVTQPPSREEGSAAAAPLPAQHRVDWVRADHPARAEVEHFIRDVFFHTYGATLNHFAELLVACRDPSGQCVAALGITPLASRRAWLECYLDKPIDQVLSARVGQPVARQQIAEVGNLAAIHPGAARALIALATRHLAERATPWVAFTATRGILNAIVRLRLAPRELCQADPLRLADQGASWGNYYATQPKVMVGYIPGAIDTLNA